AVPGRGESGRQGGTTTRSRPGLRPSRVGTGSPAPGRVEGKPPRQRISGRERSCYLRGVLLDNGCNLAGSRASDTLTRTPLGRSPCGARQASRQQRRAKGAQQKGHAKRVAPSA